MRFQLKRVSGMSLENPDKEYKLDYKDRYTLETKEIELTTIDELIELMRHYKEDRIILTLNDNHWTEPTILLYDGYYE